MRVPSSTSPTYDSPPSRERRGRSVPVTYCARMAENFTGTERYIVSEALARAVDVARAIRRPLLVKGEPGTGKTLLAVEVAAFLGLDLIRWQVKSTTKAIDGLYTYDTVKRLHD